MTSPEPTFPGHEPLPTGRDPEPQATPVDVARRPVEKSDDPDSSYLRYQEEDRSIGEIVSDVLDNGSTLIRQEIALAKAEVKESAARAGKGTGMLGGAGVAAHLFLISLTLTAWWAIGVALGSATQPSLGWSGLIVTVAWLLIAVVLGLLGKSELSKIKGVPQTQETLQKIPNAATGNEEKNR